MNIIGKIKNEKGEISYFSIFIILAINMVLAFTLLFASVKINCINIGNAAKMELNNISARIYDDTFHSQREANLTSYMGDLNLSPGYQNALKLDFIEGLAERIELGNADYELRNISLNFNNKNNKIEYIFTCDAIFKVEMLRQIFPEIKQSITLSGSHHTKFN